MALSVGCWRQCYLDSNKDYLQSDYRLLYQSVMMLKFATFLLSLFLSIHKQNMLFKIKILIIKNTHNTCVLVYFILYVIEELNENGVFYTDCLCPSMKRDSSTVLKHRCRVYRPRFWLLLPDSLTSDAIEQTGIFIAKAKMY